MTTEESNAVMTVNTVSGKTAFSASLQMVGGGESIQKQSLDGFSIVEETEKDLSYQTVNVLHEETQDDDTPDLVVQMSYEQFIADITAVACVKCNYIPIGSSVELCFKDYPEFDIHKTTIDREKELFECPDIQVKEAFTTPVELRVWFKEPGTLKSESLFSVYTATIQEGSKLKGPVVEGPVKKVIMAKVNIVPKPGS